MERFSTDSGAGANGAGTLGPEPSGLITDQRPVPQLSASADPPTTRLARVARRSTGFLLKTIETMMGSTIRLDGIERIGDGPVLFVANHFTRFETFILPYLIFLRTKRFVHSLAWHGLFHGAFGSYLTMLGARPTGDAAIKHRMVEDLMTGRHDWLIYPEGGLVKDKRQWSRGRFELDLPDRKGPPHSGAAIMALKAVLYRSLYQRAVEEGDAVLMRHYEERYHLRGPLDLAGPPLRIVPVTITYHPVRPRPNLVSRLAQRLVGELPSFLKEELLVEGSLLLHRTDISVHVGTPIEVAHYADLLRPPSRAHAACAHLHGAAANSCIAQVTFAEQLRHVGKVLGVLKDRLTHRMMHAVYSHLRINFDHLFCAALRHCPDDVIPCADFHRALYLAARAVQAHHRCHESLGADLIALVSGRSCPALESIRNLAIGEGAISVEDGCYRIHRDALVADHHVDFHEVRLQHLCAVFANELEPVRGAIKALRSELAQPGVALARRLAQLLRSEAVHDFEHERTSRPLMATHVMPGHATHLDGASCPPLRLHRGCDRIAVVLAHGYLASPGEVRDLAQHLHARGVTVVVPRLAGHGTSPAHLAATTFADWQRSYDRALAEGLALCGHVVVAGFSAGGLLAVRAAATRGDGIVGLVTIGSPLRLCDKTAHFAGLIAGWNRLVTRLALPWLSFSAVANATAYPATNYTSNPIAGVAEVRHLMHAARKSAPQVQVPALIVQADADDVVDPQSGRLLHDLLGSPDKELAQIAARRHGILRLDSPEPGIARAVFERIADFIDACRAHVQTSDRPPLQVAQRLHTARRA